MRFRNAMKTLSTRFLLALLPSPQALELAKRAKAYADELRERYMLNETVAPPKPRIKKTEMDQVDKFADQLLNDLNASPQLPQAQVDAEINAFPKSLSRGEVYPLLLVPVDKLYGKRAQPDRRTLRSRTTG